MIRAIRAAHPQRAQWSYAAPDMAALEAALRGEAAPAPAAPSPADQAADNMMAELQKLMAMQAEMAGQLTASAIPEASNFASVTIEAPESAKGGGPDSGKKSAAKKK
jgi:hypothetical protein